MMVTAGTSPPCGRERESLEYNQILEERYMLEANLKLRGDGGLVDKQLGCGIDDLSSNPTSLS